MELTSSQIEIHRKSTTKNILSRRRSINKSFFKNRKPIFTAPSKHCDKRVTGSFPTKVIRHRMRSASALSADRRIVWAIKNQINEDDFHECFDDNLNAKLLIDEITKKPAK
jgi:hypothetical protein